jgi:hypothetical protein
MLCSRILILLFYLVCSIVVVTEGAKSDKTCVNAFARVLEIQGHTVSDIAYFVYSILIKL